MFSVNIKVLSVYLVISLAGCLVDENKHNRNGDNNIFVNNIESTNIIIEHIGESDKPIIAVVLSSKCDKADIGFPSYCAEVSKDEKLSLIELLMQKSENKDSDNYMEYGSFQFKIADEKNQKLFKTNREKSISIFNEMLQILKNNDSASRLIDNNLLRIKF